MTKDAAETPSIHPTIWRTSASILVSGKYAYTICTIYAVHTQPTMKCEHVMHYADADVLTGPVSTHQRIAQTPSTRTQQPNASCLAQTFRDKWLVNQWLTRASRLFNGPRTYGARDDRTKHCVKLALPLMLGSVAAAPLGAAIFQLVCLHVLPGKMFAHVFFVY